MSCSLQSARARQTDSRMEIIKLLHSQMGLLPPENKDRQYFAEKSSMLLKDLLSRLDSDECPPAPSPADRAGKGRQYRLEKPLLR